MKEKKLYTQTSSACVYVQLLCSYLFSVCVVSLIYSELKEQLLARSSRVDDIERLKTEFNDQKREIKEQNEAELESLRRYESTNADLVCTAFLVLATVYKIVSYLSIFLFLPFH